MKLKETPEDFLVDEIPIDFSGEGEYLIVRVKKRLLNTEDAAHILAKSFGISRKTVGYAGAKDKVAVTTQYFSLRGVPEDKVQQFIHESIELKKISYHNQPLSLGDLLGNTFTIIVRELKKPLAHQENVRNYFGPQRFGRDNNNVLIGRHLIKKQFTEACELIGIDGENPIKSLRSLPKHTLTLYVHAYQSWIWNKVLEQLENPPEQLPLVGFGTELDECSVEVREAYEHLLEKEDITTRNFIIKQVPQLSAEGDERAAMAEIRNLEFGEFKDGVQEVHFSLPKGSYATTCLQYLE